MGVHNRSVSILLISHLSIFAELRLLGYEEDMKYLDHHTSILVSTFWNFFQREVELSHDGALPFPALL